MKHFTEMTDEELKELTNNELVELQMCDAYENIISTREILKTRITHLVSILSLGIIGFLFGYGIFSLVVLIPAIIMGIFVYMARDNKMVAFMSFKVLICFLEGVEIVDESNYFIVKKYINKLDLVRTRGGGRDGEYNFK